MIFYLPQCKMQSKPLDLYHHNHWTSSVIPHIS